MKLLSKLSNETRNKVIDFAVGGSHLGDDNEDMSDNDDMSDDSDSDDNPMKNHSLNRTYNANRTHSNGGVARVIKI